MENNLTQNQEPQLKLNIKRTALIGFAFFGILLLWQVYDSWCPTFLTELFKSAFPNITSEEEVQYLVGIIMALDNLAALILLPIFGALSDKTKTPIGKRMPYILVGTFVCAVAFPFIPVFFHYNNMAGVITMMAIVGIFFVLSDYLDITGEGGWAAGNIWVIEIPFLLASVLMVISCLVLFFNINENKIEAEIAPEMKRGEELSELKEKVEDDKPLTRGNKIMLILILVAEFFWFMSDNGISTFMGNYTIYYFEASSSSNMINTIVGGVGSVIGFAVGGIIAGKIGRKWTLVGGLGLTLVSYIIWAILSFTLLEFAEGSGQFPVFLYIIWFAKGFGMSLVHVNSYPMVVELCNSKKIGRLTGYYYAASMAAQTITPVALGSILLVPSFDFGILPIYALVCLGISFVIFLFVKNVKSTKTDFKKGLESIGGDD